MSVKRMVDWPRWQRWAALGASACLYALACWLLIRGSTAGVVLGLLAFGISMPLLSYSSRAVINERNREIDHRLTRGFVPPMILYMLVMLYVWPLHKHESVVWLKAVIALLPMVPLTWAMVAVVRFVLGCDELERRQHLEATGISALVVGLVSAALGFLVAAKLIAVDGGLMLLLVFPALCMVYGLVCGWNKWRYRAR